MLKLGSCSYLRAGLRTQVRAFSSTPCRSTISETIDSMANKFKEAVRHSHSEEYEGVTERGLRMLVFGKPGSGKGTLSARLVKDYDIAFVSTGDVLRKEIMAKSEVGKRAEEVVASGGLVPDELMLDVVKAELDRLRGKSWIIDGFPRTLHQGELLDAVLADEGRPLNMIVHLNVPDSVIMARIAARWVHLPSGRVYNTTYSAPKVPGKDDVTGEPLSKRPDDTPETFSKRLKAYYESTAPLLKYFADHYPDSLFSLTGSTSDEVPRSPTSTRKGQQAQQENSPSISTSHSASAAAAFSQYPQYQNQNLNPFTNQPPPDTNSPYIQTPSITYVPNLELDDNDNAKSAVDQLWPKLEALIQPFGLHRDKGKELAEGGVEGIRKDADDLRDPEEDVTKAKDARGSDKA